MNSRFRKGMAILVTLTFLMQYVIFTSPAMLTVYADTDGQAVETVIDDAAGTEDAASDAAVGDETADPLPEQPAEEQEDVLDGENNEPVVETEEAQAAPAAEEEKEIAAPAADTKAAEQAPSSGTQYLAFTSDIHNSSNNTAANRLDGWFDEIIDEFGHVDYMGFCGDMGAASANESQFWTYTDAVKRVVDNEGDEGIHGFYTTGNHEYYNGRFKTTSNATKDIYTVGAEDPYTSNANYRVYALGTTVDWGVSASSTDVIEQEQINKLTSYLEEQDGSVPIIVLAHFPLHYFRGSMTRQTTNADRVIAALNSAAAAGKTIIYLWGHNHTVSDTFYDEIYGPGDTLPYSSAGSAQIQFYYAAAGCMSDTEYGSSSSVKGKGLVIQIRDDDGDGNVAAEDLGFAYYNAGGTNVTENKDEFPIVVNPVAVESISIDEASSGGEAGQPMEDVTVEIGRTTTLHATVLPADATSRTVTWSSSDTSKATVDPSTGKVKGVAEGSVTITASVTDAVTGETFTADIGITVVPRTSSDPDYVITIDGYALSTEESPNQAQGGTSDYTYTGLSGVAYTSGEVAADNIRWIFEETDGGYYIKSSESGLYLSATYEYGSNYGHGHLHVNDTPDVWVLDDSYSLDEGTVDGSKLKSTNASSTASSPKYLGYEENPANLFTVRSADNADAITIEEAVDPKPVEYRFTVDNITAMAKENGTVSNRSIKAVLTADGKAVTPQLTYTITGDEEEIIADISEDGVISFNTGKTGTATVLVSFTYTPAKSRAAKSVTVGEDGTISGSAEITVTVKGFEPHTWSTEPVWVWADDYSSAIAKFGCLDDGCDEEIVADAVITSEQNDPTCLEPKLTVYTATVTGPDDLTYTDVKTSGGTHEVYVYKQVNAITAGGDYLIVSTNAAGSGYLLTNSSGTLSATQETIHAPEPDEDIDANYILADEVPAGAVWRADSFTATISNASYPGFKLTNAGYYLQVTGQYDDLEAVASEKYSESVWNYSRETQNYLDYHYSGNSGRESTRYAVFTDGAFAGEYDAPSAVYIYERTTMTEGEMGPHDFHFEAVNWDEGYESAHAVYRCSVCNTTSTQDVTSIAHEEKEADCERPTRTEHIATISAEDSLDGEAHVDNSAYEITLFPQEVTKEAKVYKLVSSITSGKNYLIVSANTAGTAHAVANGNNTDGASATDASVTIISGQIDGTAATYIEDTNLDQTAVWTANGSATSANFKNRDCYLYPSGNGLRVDTSSRNWTASSSSNYLRYNSYNTNYYLNYSTSSNAWECTSSSSSSTYKVYLFEETTGTITTTEYYQVDALGHTYSEDSHTAAKDPTCTEDGNIEYWTCDRCGKHFATADEDPDAAALTTVTIPALDHDWGDWEVTTPATQSAEGVETRTCSRCGETETRPIPKLDHTHGLTPVEAKAATCTEDGNSAYWVCDQGEEPCGKYFSDAEGAQEIEENSWVIPATGHVWNAPVWTWEEDGSKAVAVFTCKNNALHMESVPDEAPVAVVTDATCEAPGVKTCTANVTFNGVAYSDTKEIPLPATGHIPGEAVRENEVAATCTAAGSYDEVVYCTVCGEELSRTPKTIEELGHDWEFTDFTWTGSDEAGWTAAVANYKCKNDPAHTTTAEATVTPVTTDPTCTADGKTVYTASVSAQQSIDETSHTDSKTVVIAATGHTPGEAVRENEVAATCTAAGSYDEVVYCTVCGEELSRTPKTIDKLAHTEEVIPAVAPTCEHTGLTEGRKCSVCGEILVAQEVVDALGHDWNDPTYEWADDNSSVTAKRTCGVCGEEETETVGTTYEVITAATTTSTGTGRYTSEAFENEAFEVQTKEVEIPKLAVKPANVKNLWASQHDVGRVLFKWTGTTSVNPASWTVKYRTKKIEGGTWSGWTYKTFSGDTYQYWCPVKADYVVEIHAKSSEDTEYSRGIITTPAGGKYQAMKTVYVKNASTGKRITGDTITLKKGQTLKIAPDYEYPVSDFAKRPRLYWNQMLYDTHASNNYSGTESGSHSDIISITKSDGSVYTAGIATGTVTIKAMKAGTAVLICRAPNGRTKVFTVKVTE